jgi:hypothetical protein
LSAVAGAQEAAEEQMNAEQQAMMEAYTKAATPGEEHATMADHAGTWKATIKTWMEPGGEPQMSDGVFHRELLLGGRVLQEEYEGSFQGQPFLGYGLTGYDNVTGRWWSTWNDNMSTGVMVMWGEWNEKEGAVVYKGQAPDPMSGEMVDMKVVVRHPEDGEEVMEMYDLRGGEPVKTMEITSTRQ